MIRILFLIHDLEGGGAEKVLVNLVNHMDPKKFEITVYSLFDTGVNREFLKPHIHYRSAWKNVFPGNSHFLKLFSPLNLYNRMIGESSDPVDPLYNIVVSFLEGPCTRIISGNKNPNVRKVNWIHSTVHNEKELSASFRSIAEARECFACFDASYFVSKKVMESFMRLLPNIKNPEVLYNPNDIENILLQSQKPLEKCLQNNGTFHWCGMGKLVENKGFDRMIRIQSRLTRDGLNAHLHILGTGELEYQLKELAEKEKVPDSVTFWGYQNNPYNILKAMDLFVCASHSEGYSTAATEALIVGTPVCTVDVSGMDELLAGEQKCGVIVKNEEPALSNAVQQIVLNKKYYSTLKNGALQKSEALCSSNYIKAIENSLISLMEEEK